MTILVIVVCLFSLLQLASRLRSRSGARPWYVVPWWIFSLDGTASDSLDIGRVHSAGGAAVPVDVECAAEGRCGA